MKERDIRVRSKRDLAPSDAEFDRSNISDADYIELLLFEIKELKSTLLRKDQLIQSMQGNLNLEKQDDIPRRSAKRNPTETETAADDMLDKNLESLKTELDSLKSTGVENLSSLQKHKDRVAPPLPQMPVEYQRKDSKESVETVQQKLSSGDFSTPDALKVAQQKVFDIKEEQERIKQQQFSLEREQKRLDANKLARQNSQKTEQEQLSTERQHAERTDKERVEQQRLDREEIQKVRLEKELQAQQEPSRKEQEDFEQHRLELRIADHDSFQPESQKPEQKASAQQQEIAITSPISTSTRSVENDITSVSQSSMLPESMSAGSISKTTGDEPESNRSSVYSQEEMQLPALPEIINSPIADPIGHSINTQDISSGIDHGDDVTLDSIYDPSDATSQDYSISTNMNKSLDTYNASGFTQHKNQSTGSFQSYKSRIKLPQSLQQQQAHGGGSDLTLTPTKSSYSAHSAKPPIPHSKGSRDLNLKDLSLDIPLQSRNQAVAVRSPAAILTNEPQGGKSPGLNSKVSTPVLDDLYKRAPSTPDEFYNGGISNFLSNDLTKHNTHGSSVSSPINTVQYSPATNHSSGFEVDSYKTPHNNIYSQDSLYPNRNGSAKLAGSSSSFSVIRNQTADDQEIPLFVKPEDFQTIRILVVSTLSQGNASSQSAAGLKKLDDVLITLAICDDTSGKEIWRIRKSFNQVIGFDNEIRPTVEFFGLPVLPDKSLFLSTTPSKIDLRRNALQNYFNTLFVMPHIPHLILFRICKYLSLDVVNPLDDFKSGARKEGYLLRRYKSLGTSWKVRWCQVEGPMLEIYDAPGGSMIEQVSLVNCQIGRQSNDSVAEEKGYRHAFLIMESRKTSKISGSTPKHFFCAETDEERDEWVSILIDANQTLIDSTAASEAEDIDVATITPGRGQGDYVDDAESYLNSKGTKGYPEQEELREKKLKKRGLFQFRVKNNNSQNSSQPLEASSVVDADASIITSSTVNGTDPTMQEYLDRMNLDGDVSTMIFGKELAHAYNISHHTFLGREIPSICFRCIDFLLKSGAIYEQGIFRLSGSASTIRHLKQVFNVQHDVDLFTSELKPDINTVAGLLKTFLREMPSPIIGTKTHNDLRQILSARGNEANKSSIGYIFRDYFNDANNIDQIHYDLTFIVLKFLKEIVNNNKANRMNLRNVCIVFVPTLNISLDVLSTLLIDFGCIFENSEPTPDADREVLDLNIPTF